MRAKTAYTFSDTAPAILAQDNILCGEGEGGGKKQNVIAGP
jgi:hypothetical protein